jgi:hypothetical protein
VGLRARACWKKQQVTHHSRGIYGTLYLKSKKQKKQKKNKKTKQNKTKQNKTKQNKTERSQHILLTGWT